MQILLLCSGLLLPFTVHSVCGVGLTAAFATRIYDFIPEFWYSYFARWHCFMTCLSPLCPFLCSRLLKLWLFVGRSSFAFIGADGSDMAWERTW